MLSMVHYLYNRALENFLKTYSLLIRYSVIDILLYVPLHVITCHYVYIMLFIIDLKVYYTFKCLH